MSEDINKNAWKRIIRLGAAAAFLSELVFRVNYSAEFIQFNGFGLFRIPASLPVSAREWFDLIQDSPLVAFVLLDGVDIPHYLLVGVVFLSLFQVLRSRRPVLSGLALGSVLSGALIFVTANPAFRILVLSQKYSSISSLEKAQLLSRGEELLTRYNPLALGSHGWADPARFLILLGGVLISAAMLSSPYFPRLTGILGLFVNSISLLYYPLLLLAPIYYWLVVPISAPFRLVWHIMLGFNLFRIAGRSDDDQGA
jgi:hypothetical protein